MTLTGTPQLIVGFIVLLLVIGGATVVHHLLVAPVKRWVLVRTALVPGLCTVIIGMVVLAVLSANGTLGG